MKVLFFLTLAGMAFGQDAGKPVDKAVDKPVQTHTKLAADANFHFKYLLDHRQLLESNYKAESEKMNTEQQDLVKTVCKIVDATPGVDCNIDLASGEMWKELPKPATQPDKK